LAIGAHDAPCLRVIADMNVIERQDAMPVPNDGVAGDFYRDAAHGNRVRSDCCDEARQHATVLAVPAVVARVGR
jgi:hypothetical protein